jgi:signal transduction histidine kinase
MADVVPVAEPVVDESRARLESLLAEQAALRRVATLVAQGTEPGALFDLVCEELAGVLGVESTDMLRFEDDATATVVGLWNLGDAPAFPTGTRVSTDGGTVTARLRRTGRPQRVDDYEGVEGELAERLRASGIRSAVGAPIEVAGRLWGGIMAVSDRPYAFAEGIENRINNFAELVTAALANADAREQLAASRRRIVETADEARRRIERDLHDGAQQRLVSLALELRLLRDRLQVDPETARELDSARAELDEALAELRELARGIHPSVLADRGLPAAIESLSSRAPVPVELALSGCDGLPPAVETTVYFLVAEALTNVAKHADCERVAVEVRASDEWLAAEVRDDGVGGADGSGSGLRGLADRVNALGGTLAIESAPGSGTIVAARIPLGRG